MTLKSSLSILALALALPSAPALAGGLSGLSSLSDSEFNALSEAVGATVSYKPILPPEPQGLSGFDIGVAMTSTSASLKGAYALDKAGATLHLDDAIQSYRLHINKGLPFGVDIGAVFTSVPSLGLDADGLEVRYALLSGDYAVPTVSVRGAYTRVDESNHLSMDTRSVDLSISKGFAMLTPYAGIGQVWVDSKGKGAASHLSDELELTKFYAGLNMTLGLVNVAFETDVTGSTTSWGLKMGVRW